MNGSWFEHTRIVAYHLWEYTNYDNALELWYAAEDIACFFEQNNILDIEMVDGIKKLGYNSEGYVWFVRNIAFRLYLCTGNTNKLQNWYLVERLLSDRSWVQNLAAMAALLNSGEASVASQVRSERVLDFYGF